MPVFVYEWKGGKMMTWPVTVDERGSGTLCDRRRGRCLATTGSFQVLGPGGNLAGLAGCRFRLGKPLEALQSGRKKLGAYPRQIQAFGCSNCLRIESTTTTTH